MTKAWMTENMRLAECESAPAVGAARALLANRERTTRRKKSNIGGGCLSKLHRNLLFMLCGPLSCCGKFAIPQQTLGQKTVRQCMVDSLGWRKASKERGAIHSAFAGFVWRRATSRGPSHHLYADRAFILAAVQRNALILRYASRELRADREIVLAALQQDASCIRYVSKELRADYEVVMTAVKKGNLSKKGGIHSNLLRSSWKGSVGSSWRQCSKTHPTSRYSSTSPKRYWRIARLSWPQ